MKFIKTNIFSIISLTVLAISAFGMFSLDKEVDIKKESDLTAVITVLEERLAQAQARNGMVLGATTDGTILIHTFDDGSASDSSGEGNNGTLVGGPTSAAGQIGNAINLNGTNQYVDIPDVVEGLSTVTFSAWVKVSDLSGATRVIFNQTGAGADPIFLTFAGGSGTNDFKYTCTIGTTNDTTGTMSATQYNNSNWHHVACAYDGSNVRLYVDGVLANNNPTALTGTIVTTANNLTLGSVGSNTWSGQIDDARIYNRALSANEVSSLFVAGGGQIASGGTGAGGTSGGSAGGQTGGGTPNTPAQPVAQPATPGQPANTSGIYIVDQNHPQANDTNNGTEDFPFKTIQKAVNVVQPGQTVLIKAGTYQQTIGNCPTVQCEIMTVSNSGAAGRPITIKPFGNGKVILRGLGFEDRDYNGNGQADGPLYHSKREKLIRILGNYIHLSGLEVTNSSGIGISIEGSHNIVEEISVHDNWFSGLIIGDTTRETRGNIARYIESHHSRHGSGFGLIRDSQPLTGILTENIIEESLAYRNGYEANNQVVMVAQGDTDGGGNSDGAGTTKLCADTPYFSTPEHLSYFDTNGDGVLEAFANVCPRNILRGLFLFLNSDDGLDTSFADSLIANTVSFGNSGDFRSHKGFKQLRDVNNVQFIGNVAYANDGLGFETRTVEGGVFLHNMAISNLNQGLFGIRANAQAYNNMAYSNGMSDMILPTSATMGSNWIGDRSGSFSGNPQLVNPNLFKDSQGKISVSLPNYNTIREKVEWMRAQFNAAFTLQAGSGALDRGVPASYRNPITGQIESFQYAGSAPDIGAFERGLVSGGSGSVQNPVLPPAPAPVDTDGDGVIDINDLCSGTPSQIPRNAINVYGCIKPRLSSAIFDIRPNLDHDIRGLANVRIGRSGIGMITWSRPITLSRLQAEMDIDGNLIISNKKVVLNSGNLSELNYPATITFYGITETNPTILKDGIQCTTCTVTVFGNGTLEVVVQGFSTYEVVEGTVPPAVNPAAAIAPSAATPIPPIVSGGGGGSSGGFGGVTMMSANQGNAQMISGCAFGNIYSTITGQRCPSPSSAISSNNISGHNSYPGSGYAFTKTLKLGMNDGEVRILQQYLNANGFVVASAGNGSVGRESTYFGPATLQAVKKFQASAGLQADGVFGQKSRAAITASPQSFPVSQAVTSSQIMPQAPSQTLAPLPGATSGLSIGLGSSGPMVKLLRQKLRAAGYFESYGSSPSVPASADVETSNFGITTEAALKKYQCDKNIVCSGKTATTGWGILGPQTKTSLGL